MRPAFSECSRGGARRSGVLRTAEAPRGLHAASVLFYAEPMKRRVLLTMLCLGNGLAHLAAEAQSATTGSEVKANAAGVLKLTPKAAKLNGSDLRLEWKGNRHNVGHWQSAASTLEWTVNFPKPGTYQVELEYSLGNGNKGSEIEIWAGPALLVSSPKPTATWEAPEVIRLGGLDVEQAGPQKVTIKVAKKASQYILNVYELRLIAPK